MQYEGVFAGTFVISIDPDFTDSFWCVTPETTIGAIVLKFWLVRRG